MAMKRVAAALVASLLLVAGCSMGSSDESSDGSSRPGEAPVDGGGSSDGDGSIVVPEFPADGRQLIVRMQATIEVDDVTDAVERTIELARINNGQLSGSYVDLTGDRDSGQLEFRLPPEDVEPFITGLDPAVGILAALTGSAEDVTSQITDLDAQIRQAEISVERVTALLEAATNIPDIIALETELTNRQTRLEQLRAAKAEVAQLVALATVTVSLIEVDEAATDRGVLGDIGNAFAKGWEAFVAALVWALLSLGYSAPFLALLALLAVVWTFVSRRLRWRRRRRGGRPSPTVGDAVPGAPPGTVATRLVGTPPGQSRQP